MDVFEVLIFFLIPFILFCLCGFCCRSKKRGIIFSKQTRKSDRTFHELPYSLSNLQQNLKQIIYNFEPLSPALIQHTNFPWGFVLFIIIIIFFSMCTHCCRNERGAVYRTPVVVTSATHTAPGGYPAGVQTVSVYPTSSSGYQQTAYPQQAPYPVVGVPTAMPMPMQHAQMNPNPIGINPQINPPYPTNAVPYPPNANYNYSMNPPSYDNAVGSNQPAYEKQAPYNPGYSQGY